jgi:hypothetical protein
MDLSLLREPTRTAFLEMAALIADRFSPQPGPAWV